MAAGAALLTRADPSQAAYGESANIFGKQSNKAGGCPASCCAHVDSRDRCSVSTRCVYGLHACEHTVDT